MVVLGGLRSEGWGGGAIAEVHPPKPHTTTPNPQTPDLNSELATLWFHLRSVQLIAARAGEAGALVEVRPPKPHTTTLSPRTPDFKFKLATLWFHLCSVQLIAARAGEAGAPAEAIPPTT